MSTISNNNLLWLRAETKPFEQRTLLTPQDAVALVRDGYEVVVERSAQRVFDDAQYESAGCQLVDTHAWHEAPQHAIILGLKELDPGDGPFSRRHVHFAHVFKEQSGWEKTLEQFRSGSGSLYDLEYLTDDSGNRIAAFGYWAGFVGAALAVLAYCAKSNRVNLGGLRAWKNKDDLLASVQHELLCVADKPTALVMGALGRCGSGAVELLTQCNLVVSAWDQKEGAAGGPFDALLEHDLFINCVFIKAAVPPFTTRDHLASSPRRLQVISDVSCDPFGKYNPLPVYDKCTTMDKPVVDILPGNVNQPSLQLVAIDHLPSLLPRESSEHFSAQLLPTLLELRHTDAGVWRRAYDVYAYYLQRLPSEDEA